MSFVQTISDLATRSQNIEILHNAGKEFYCCWRSDRSLHLPTCPAGVMALLRPLLLDVVPGVQQTAALALGRLADSSDSLAEAVVKENILPDVVQSVTSHNVSIPSSLWCFHVIPASEAVCLHAGPQGAGPLKCAHMGFPWLHAWGLKAFEKQAFVFSFSPLREPDWKESGFNLITVLQNV